MLNKFKKLTYYTLIFTFFNTSFQALYAFPGSEKVGQDQDFEVASSPQKKINPSLEDPQTNATRVPQAAEADVVSWFFLTPLKTMIGAVSLVKQGVRFALENPGQAIAMGFLFQARTVTSTLSLSSLTLNQGFRISGATVNDQNDHSGISASSAGDFNGDGLNDIIIGAWYVNSHAGESYLIYGTQNPPSLINLSSLIPQQGFAISGAAAGDHSGNTASSAGDFNGDGFNDVIIGAPFANSHAGKTYVIYGTNSTPSLIRLSSLTPQQGFAISGAAAEDYSGISASSAGDFNGDDMDDVIIGVPYTNSNTGKIHVIYGTNITPSPISLSFLTALQGFTINGATAEDIFGKSVSSAGDFNGDDLDDVIIGAASNIGGPGNSYVIYGTKNPPRLINVSSLTPQQGFNITGATTNDRSGSLVSSAGDFNADNFNDVIIGAPNANSGAGKSYVIYGTNSTPSSISLSSLTLLQGITINGAAGDTSGISASSAGDFNGDGFHDVIIGAYGANNHTGKGCVIYGTNSPPSSISLSSLTPQQGFIINGVAAGDGTGSSVSSAGDFNGDNLNDVIIVAPHGNNLLSNSYIIYGASASSPASTSMMTSTGTLTSATLPTSQMGSNPTPSSGLTVNPTSTGTGAGTNGNTPTSPQPGEQDQAGEASSQSLSKWLAGAALLIGQERF